MFLGGKTSINVTRKRKSKMHQLLYTLVFFLQLINALPPVISSLQSNGISRVWRKGIVPFSIEAEYTPEERRIILATIHDLVLQTSKNSHSCITFVPRTTERSYVVIGPFKSCSSDIGRQGGVQTVSLTSDCVSVPGIILHELLHTLGLPHEHTRPDRDKWLIIHWKNIIPGKEHNFRLYDPDLIDFNMTRTAYDYGSIMHADPYAFAINPNIPTIVPNDPKAMIGQRHGLSILDTEKIHLLYGCH